MKKLTKEFAECKSFGDFMRYNREIRGLSARMLSDASGIAIATIYHWEEDTTSPSLLYLCDVCDALSVTIDEYIGRSALNEQIQD